MKYKNLIFNRKLIVDDWVTFIITENCSFQCSHCLRGDRRPKTISKKVIDIVLSQIEIKGVVHLSGGEPLLQSEIVVYLLDEIYRLGNKPSEIRVITNGSVGVKKFEEFIRTFDGKHFKIGLMVSNDYYHTQERLRLNKGEDNILTRIREYQKIMCDHNFERPIDDYFYMLEEYESFRNGRGVSGIGKGKNIVGSETCVRDFRLYPNVTLKQGHINGDFQVNTDGRITRSMDISWEEIDTHYDDRYNIINNSLKRILRGKSKNFE